MADEVRVAITSDEDLVTARAQGRALAERLGFPRPDPTLIATAISEIARNIVVHVGQGEIVLRPVEDTNRYGLVVIAIDEGSGHPQRGGGAARRLQRTRRPRVGHPRSPATHGRLHDRVRRRRHHGDDDEVEVPRRARTATGGATPTCLSRRRPNRSNGALSPGAGAARRTSGDLAVVSPRRDGTLVAGIDGLGHGSEAARAARRAADVVRETATRRSRPSDQPLSRRAPGYARSGDLSGVRFRRDERADVGGSRQRRGAAVER